MSQSSTHPHSPENPVHDHHDHEHPHDHSPAKPAVKKSAPPAIGCGACCGGSSHAHGEGDDDDHAGHDHGVLPSWPRIYAALAVALGAEVAHWYSLQYVGMALAIIAILLSGLGVYKAGIKSLVNLKLGIHALMAVAVTGAFLIGQWPEAAMVMALYAAAERIEDQAMDRARNAIRSLLNLAPETADVMQPDGSIQKTAVADVSMGATVRIAPGALVPLDGTVTQGESAVNQAPITGESQLADKAVGDSLYAGSVNQNGELQMQVTAPPGNTLLARIVHAVEEAQASRAPTQRFVDRFAQVYTPIVFVLALLLAVLAPLVAGWTWHDSIYQALALLVIACPCALVISTPVTVVSALTAAAKRGILIKGGSALEEARKLKVIALDKTGTLTTGSPALVQWQALREGDDDDAAHVAWQLASRSDHPVSRAIAAGLAAKMPAQIDNNVQDLKALPGRGVEGSIFGQRYVLGNLRVMREMGLASDALEKQLAEQELQGRTVTLLSDEQSVLAFFAVADPLRSTSREAVEQLKALGVEPIVLSGDNPATVKAVAAEAGITDARGGLLPHDKLELLATFQKTKGPTAMTGDGINDAPALAKADVGFAMGGAHSTGMAMETAAVVLMNDDLRRIPDTVRLSQSAHSILWQNISLALGIKIVFFALALTGHATMWMAVVADMGVSLLVVANGLRLRNWAGK
ncbi:heavy metal translocating P-type ATPase [Diaphorobacter sp. HDW4B]|uniref:heavy metal translocating P-type ATPase n=1 Tax=Diaphorobacter sp. HDW4B TaxID=2714925 RepID=UPI00140DA548|nr:heavy metal translocating P-type ATPase [Diaphorobacter sp. HDW4B]QIL72500.1 heavy metal translocating P-type ATPase [Diaphorobacter sp. HDW4B]